MSFLNFEERANPGKKTKIWDIFSAMSGDVLGAVLYQPSWRKYTFHPVPNTLFDAGCLSEIAQFLNNHKDARQ